MDDLLSPQSADSEDTLAQCLRDSIFESQPSFSFVDAEDQHGPYASIGSPQAENSQFYFNPTNDTSMDFDQVYSFPEDAPQLPQGSELFRHSLDPAHDWHKQNAGPYGFAANVPNANFLQLNVRNCRRTKHQLGQITPLDDTVDEFGPSKTSSAQAAATEAADRARTKKSKRAFKAAHQRHAKSNSMHRKSQESNLVISENAASEAGDKEKCREKNRLAAARCRAKKKETMEDVKVKHRKSSDVNSSLKKQVQDLRRELTDLRTYALSHQDCNCLISRYNITQAGGVALKSEVTLPQWVFMTAEGHCNISSLGVACEAWTPGRKASVP